MCLSECRGVRKWGVGLTLKREFTECKMTKMTSGRNGRLGHSPPQYSGIFYIYSYTEACILDKMISGVFLSLKLVCAYLLNPVSKLGERFLGTLQLSGYSGNVK